MNKIAEPDYRIILKRIFGQLNPSSIKIKEARRQFTLSGGEEIEIEGYILVSGARIKFQATLPPDENIPA